jgi:hypothetical protein
MPQMFSIAINRKSKRDTTRNFIASQAFFDRESNSARRFRTLVCRSCKSRQTARRWQKRSLVAAVWPFAKDQPNNLSSELAVPKDTVEWDRYVRMFRCESYCREFWRVTVNQVRPRVATE